MPSGTSQTSSVDGADKENSMPPPVGGSHGQNAPILYGSAVQAAADPHTRPNVTNTQLTVLNQTSAFQHPPRLGSPFVANANSIPAGPQLVNSGSGSGQPTYSPMTEEKEWEIRHNSAAMLSETMHIAINGNAHCGVHNCPVCVRVFGNIREGSDQVDDSAENKPNNLCPASESPSQSEVEGPDVAKQFKGESTTASASQKGPRSETSSVIFLGSISAMASLTPPSSPCPATDAQDTSALAAAWEESRETDEAWQDSCQYLFPSDSKIRKWSIAVGEETTQLLTDAYADAKLDSDMPTSPKRLKVGTNNVAVPVSRRRSFADRWEEEIFQNIYDSAVLLYKRRKDQASGSPRPQHERHISGAGAISQSVADEFDSMSHTTDGKRRLSAGAGDKDLPLAKEESSNRDTSNRAIKKPLSPRVTSRGPSYSEITSQNVTDGDDATNVDPFEAYDSMPLQNKLYPGNTATRPITISSGSSMRSTNRVSKNTIRHKPHHTRNSLGGASSKIILGLISDIVDGGCDCGCLDGARAVHKTAKWAEDAAAKQFVDEVEKAAKRYVAAVGAPVAHADL